MPNIIPTIKSADISMTLNSIAGDFGLRLMGEVQDLAGFLNNDAAYAVQRAKEAQGLFPADWGYYAKQLADVPSGWFKVWIRWNLDAAIYDCYLVAEAGVIFDHETPYIGTISQASMQRRMPE